MVRQTSYRAVPQYLGYWTFNRRPRYFIDNTENVIQWFGNRLVLVPTGKRLGHGICEVYDSAAVGCDNCVPNTDQRHLKSLARFIQFLKQLILPLDQAARGLFGNQKGKQNQTAENGDSSGLVGMTLCLA